MLQHLELIGVAAGVASGDVENVATNTVAGVAGGYKLGSGVAGASQKFLQVDGLDETYKKAFHGEKGYRERVAKENQKKMAQDENTIRTIMDKENKSRAEAFKRAKELSEYMEYKRKRC